jgi:hypothetical protein
MAAQAPGDSPCGGTTGIGDLALTDQINDEKLGSGDVGAE